MGGASTAPRELRDPWRGYELGGKDNDLVAGPGGERGTTESKGHSPLGISPGKRE